jgi:hypothetical protein
MEQQITQFSEYALTGNVADIQKVVPRPTTACR